MPQQDLDYRDTFILVSPDCKAQSGTVPKIRVDAPTVASIQYEMMAAHPYRYTQKEILFASHVMRGGLSAPERQRRHVELWDAFFSKSQACLRTSPLAKTYGWGIHFDARGRAALVSRDSAFYTELASGKKGGPALHFAMRSKRPTE